MSTIGRLLGRGGPLPELAVRIDCFREVLNANNSALGFIARIQEALQSPAPLSSAELRQLVAGVAVQTFRMVSNLNRMTGERQRKVLARFQSIRTELAHRVELTPALRAVGLVVPLSQVDTTLVEAVGAKSGYLGEAARILHDQVPVGCATTVAAYRAFVASSGLRDRIAPILATVTPGDVASCFAASARLVQLIETTPLPDEVALAIEQAVAALPGYPDLRLAVRSSALQEGGVEMSFAGQYRSLLNVPPAAVADAFRRVVASKYSPPALTYRLGRGYDDDEVAMCCCIVGMIDAVAAGVLYTSFPAAQGERTVLQAVRGLGLSAVDGSAEPDSYLLDRKSHRVVEIKRGQQAELLQCALAGGTEKQTLDHARYSSPALTVAQALRVAELGWQLEASLGMPLDVEWALDHAGAAFVLQVRPLSDLTPSQQGRSRPPVEGAPVLVDHGTRASRGAGSGPVHQVTSDLDILRFCPGEVAVLHEANPRFAVLLPQAAAVVADLGELTGHLATVARELRVPALFATRDASARLAAGAVVTVDADAGVVYAGRVEAALAAAAPAADSGPRDPNRELLRSVAEVIVPLTLRDRLASGYAPRKCKTLHDIIRYCHQATIEAMFELGDRALREKRTVRRLVSAVPIDCRVLDIGGGLVPEAGDDEVTVEQVTCAPLRALWQGMTDPRVQWRLERPISLRGFMSAVTNYNFDQDSRLRSLGEPSYAVISADYMNLNSRIGYHFATIDARLGEVVECNYASFRFVGGATGVEQRSRRALLIQRLLAANGFETDCHADLVNARIRHRPAAEMEQVLVLIGLIMGYANHLDMALTSDDALDRHSAAFLRGDFGFKGGGSDG